MRGPGLEEEIWVALALPHSFILDRTAAHWALPGPTRGVRGGGLVQPLLPRRGDCPQTSPFRGTPS